MKPKKTIEKEEKKIETKTQKEIYLELYETLKILNVRSISDLENLIANCRD